MFLKALTTLLGAVAVVQALPSSGFGNLVEKRDDAGFERFEFVTAHLADGDKLARSSAPHYKFKDSDQNLTAASIDFLKENKITHVISLNEEANAEHIKTALDAAGIAYTPLPVVDFQSPTLEDFAKGYEGFKKHRSGTLVWCGFGHGRTGTMISALQTYVESEKASPQPLTRADYDTNHVEKEPQRQALVELQKNLALQKSPELQNKPVQQAEEATNAGGGNRSQDPRVRQEELCEEIKRDDCSPRVAQCVFEETKKPQKKNFEETWASVEQCVKSFFGV